jgi:hypothetical protein
MRTTKHKNGIKLYIYRMFTSMYELEINWGLQETYDNAVPERIIAGSKYIIGIMYPFAHGLIKFSAKYTKSGS